MPSGEAILRALENIQATVSAVQKEVSDMKETHSSIISSQRHLLNEVLRLQNHKKKFYTRLQDVPLEIIIHIFAWIPVRTVLKYRRLSKAINQCLMTAQFAVLNIQTVDAQKKSSHIGFDRIWFYLPEPYQTVVASAIPGQLKSIQSYFNPPIETKGLPESVTRLTALEIIDLSICSLVGNIPDGIGSLQNLTDLNLADNSLTGMLPSSLSALFALETLDLSNNELSGEFPALPNLHALNTVIISGNRFTGAIPTVFGNPQSLIRLNAERNCFTIIPATIGQLTNLEELDISANCFECEIPAGIWNLTQLTYLCMSNCQLSGMLAGVGALQNLTYLDMSNNQFSGELPSREIQTLENLEELHLIRNQFLGGEKMDMMESNLCTMCADPDIQRNCIEWPEVYPCNSRHEVTGDFSDSENLP
ncbi:hypothetical protein CcCBS67573_g10302 [Chytriomyces confervae]|uniref:Uncharacterized protein n=1 Tax=Chytriomyces confervae TaxID=246404 RepID=A0A507D5X4_9FUNG|nr:hypothetical protein CcCBS67573_g10302 [Chytriomyces confervae]